MQHTHTHTHPVVVNDCMFFFVYAQILFLILPFCIHSPVIAFSPKGVRCWCSVKNMHLIAFFCLFCLFYFWSERLGLEKKKILGTDRRLRHRRQSVSTFAGSFTFLTVVFCFVFLRQFVGEHYCLLGACVCVHSYIVYTTVIRGKPCEYQTVVAVRLTHAVERWYIRAGEPNEAEQFNPQWL